MADQSCAYPRYISGIGSSCISAAESMLLLPLLCAASGHAPEPSCPPTCWPCLKASTSRLMVLRCCSASA